MSRAQGSSVELAYLVETTAGTTPAGTPNAIRKNSDSLSGTNGVVESGEIRSDGESASDIQGNKNIGGDIVSELSAGSHDVFLESAMFDSWTSTDTGLATLDASGTTNSYSRTVGSFVTDGFVVGQWVLVAGFTNAANNGWFKVTAVSALTLNVSNGTLVTESGGGNEQISAKYMKGGSTGKYLSIFKRWLDINSEVIFAGCLVDSMAISMAPEKALDITFTVNGQNESDPTVVGTAAVDVSTADPMTSFSGSVLIDNVENSNLTSFDFTLTNNISDGFVVGNRFKVDQFKGRRQSSGNVAFYFEDLQEYADSNAHTAKDLGFSVSEGTDFYGFTFPRSYWDLPTPPTDGEGALSMSGPFRAKYDATAGASIIISRSL